MTMISSKIKTATIPAGVAAVVLISGGARSAAADYATKIIDYRPAPGQFVNLEITTDPSGALGPVAVTGGTDPATDGIVSLGGFGGYIVLGFDRPIKNDPRHPYGIDFTIIGNAISSGSSNESCEPGAVLVMKDVNGNGIPDDGPWLELAGSDYHLSSTRKNTAITYYNPLYNNAHTICWRADDGATGALLPTAAHTQPYYPDPFLFPGIDLHSYTLSGNRIAGALDKRNPAGIKFHKTPAFGYADCHGTPGGFDGTKPNNPYYPDEKGPVTDGFDISWAVDAEGNYVELDQIDFIRIYTAGAGNAGWLGEWSSEIDGVVLTEPDQDYVLRDYYLSYLSAPQAQAAIGSTCRFEGLLFKNGRPCNEGIHTYTVDDETIGTISPDGVFTPLKEGKTTVRFSSLDGIAGDAAEITVTSLTGVVIDIDGKASALATTECIIGESIFLNVESTDNYETVIPGSKGNRYTHDRYTWYNPDPSVGTIDEHGTFTAAATGTTVLTAVSEINPSLCAEVKITVKKTPAVVLNKPSMTISQSEPAGNWKASTLFKTTNKSTAIIVDAATRSGNFPIEVKGNRIVYDFSDCTESVADVIDITVLHYGGQYEFSLPVNYVAEGSAIENIPADTEPVSEPATFTVFTVDGRQLLQSATMPDLTQLPSGIYIIRKAAPGAVSTIKIAVP